MYTNISIYRQSNLPICETFIFFVDSGGKKVVCGNSFSKSQRQLTFNKSVPSAAPPNTNKSATGHSSIEMDSSDDEFDKILTDHSKVSKYFNEPNSSGKKVLQAPNLSNSIAKVGKNGVVSKSKEYKKSENQKLCRIDPPSGSDTNDDELDASLIRYANVTNSDDVDEKTIRKEKVSPGKTSSPINSLDRKKKDKMELELQPIAAQSPKKHLFTESNKKRHNQVRNH